MRERRSARGLRTSVTVGFALGALGLSTVLAVGTYVSARHSLVEQRERVATRQAFTDAALVRDSLLTSGAQVSDVLGSIAAPAGVVIYVRRYGQWYSSALDTEGPELTTEVQPIVSGGSAALGWTEAAEHSAVVVGVPLAAVDAEYYEVSAADGLDETLWTLAFALAIFAGLTTLGGAAVGRMASRRVLAPLRDVTTAAVRVSAGDFRTRLAATSDPDLASLVGSFNHMIDALDARIEQDARFAADVSHELRTPVTTLTTSLSLLEQSPDLPPRSAQAVQLMADELARFRRALEDLLALGRLDAGASETAVAAVPVGDLVRQAVRAADQSLDLVDLEDARGSAVGDGDGPVVQVDRVQMVRALANLLRNAEIHGGGATGVVVVDRGEVVEIRVEDRGAGVPEADRERIFERFARAGGARAGTGSGLGLSIVEQTVRRHHGHVWCTGRPGGGSVFVVQLPTTSGGDA